uniref:Uncharacterized protein n=1 Tax=Cannabis sativa TaxID=3483 RepID=A0A803QBL8_CANSA
MFSLFLKKGRQHEDQNRDDPIIKDAKSGESSFGDVEVNSKDVLEDMHEDDPQEKVTDDNVGEKSQPNESDPVKRKGNHTSGHSDQTNSRGRVTKKNKIEVEVQKLESQREKPPPSDSSNHDEDVDKVHPASDDSGGSLSTNDLRRRLNAKKERTKAEKVRPHRNDLINHIHDRICGRESSSDKTQRLKRKVEELMKITEKISRKQSCALYDSEAKETEPSVKIIIDAPLSKHFRMPQIELYEGRTDPRDHLSKYNCIMKVSKARDDAKCLYFSLTLSKFPEDWWKRLSPGSIQN